MKTHLASAFVLAVALAGVASAQDAGLAPSASQNGVGTGQGRGYGQRGGRGGFGGMGMMGRGVMGTVTEVAADHYTVRTDAGEIYTIHFSANTRIFKMPAGTGGGPGGGEGNDGGQDRGMGRGMGSGAGWAGNPPQQLKSSDIKTGDVIEARGEVDATVKSLGAVAVVQLDPERVKQIRTMEASYGKTWLMGRVTAIDGVKVTLTGAIDNAPHSFVADEDTAFRRRREPITLADIQVGDNIRVDGAVKDGVFTATSVGDLGTRQGPPPQQPGAAASPSAPQ
ncbi:MAG TPA: DUF5666 domain-containing protein [Terracidiphilus sp.]|nr:DUF5666 domain-containing protein [Terracidiphilus sp.]